MIAHADNNTRLSDAGETGGAPALPGLRPVIAPTGVYGREDVALWLGVSVDTLDRIRAQGKFPAGFRLDGSPAGTRRKGASKQVRWRGADLLQYVDNLAAQTRQRAEGI